MKADNPIPTIATPLGADLYPRLSWFKQDRLRAANVMVVGCGALGNEVLKNLALFGVGHLVVVDFDVVEPSNLTRSILFNRADAQAGRPKALVAAERIQEINPEIRVLPLLGDITHDVGLGLLRRMDVVVGCVDNRWARYCLNRLCMRANVPWVDGGIDGLEGTARVFMPGKNCYACNLGPEALKDLMRLGDQTERTGRPRADDSGHCLHHRCSRGTRGHQAVASRRAGQWATHLSLWQDALL